MLLEPHGGAIYRPFAYSFPAVGATRERDFSMMGLSQRTMDFATRIIHIDEPPIAVFDRSFGVI